MAYVYGELKKAILGNSGDKVSKDMSPNMIKALFIGRESIIVIYHTRQSRTYRLDFMKVAEELGNGSVRRESLNSVLNKYKMGCIEELYADASYRNVPGGYLDLDRYVKELGRTRLRLYGWYNGNAESVISFYEKARLSHDYLYGVGTDVNVRGKLLQIEAYPVKNTADHWYKVHDLRPNDYIIDKTLVAYFNQVDGYIEAKVKEVEEAEKKKGVSELIKGLVEYEDSLIKEYQLYAMLKKIAGSIYGGEIGSLVLNNMFCIKGKEGIKLLTGDGIHENLVKCAKMIVRSDNGESDYKNVSIEELSERLKSGNGLFGTKDAYYSKMKSLVREGNRSKVLLLSLYNVFKNQSNGKVSFDVNSMLSYLEELYNSKDWFHGFNMIICGLLGFKDYDNVVSAMMMFG